MQALLDYARNHGLIDAEDIAYARNRVLEVLRLSDYDPARGGGVVPTGDVDELLRPLLDEAARRGLIDPDTATQRDLWDTAIMGCFVPRPSALERPRQEAGDYFVRGLEHCGVFGADAVGGCRQFLQQM